MLTMVALANGLMSDWLHLTWTAGQDGKPGLNADIQNAAEATRMIADRQFEIKGTNAASSCSSYNAEGGISLTTTTTSGDQVILCPHEDTAQSGWYNYTWGTDRELAYEEMFATGSEITACIIWSGLKLTNTPVVATDDDQVFVRYEAGVASGYFQVVYSIGGTDTTVTTDELVVAGTTYKVRFEFDTDRICRVYINDRLVATTTSAMTSADLKPFLGVQTAAAAAKTIVTRKKAIRRRFNAA